MATNHHKPGQKPGNGNGTDRWAKTWTINDTDSDALSNVLLVKNGITRFTLVPAKINNEVVGYQVKYDAGEMTDHWHQTILFIRGADQAGLPSSNQQHPLPNPMPLQPWKKGNPRDYLEVAHAVGMECAPRPSTERLEGDIHVNGVPEAVTLYQVDGAISGKSFLVIAVASDQGQVTGNESGIAHGNS